MLPWTPAPELAGAVLLLVIVTAALALRVGRNERERLRDELDHAVEQMTFLQARMAQAREYVEGQK